ncbi:MAG: HIT domain-containing protein [Nanoarchaeota archaeon]|nr:HIT domain-containing protein [Nanoarchaeota archaeon]
MNQEQIDSIKDNLLSQLENFPEDQRFEIKDKILAMSNEEFEEFLKQNELLSEGAEGNEGQDGKKQCLFCLITEGKIKSYKIAENSENIAILDINPLSKGHSLVIPKKHVKLKDLPESSFELAEKVVENLKEKFSPKTFKINKNEVLEHGVVEVIPIYGDEKERKKASDEELAKLQKIILEKTEKPVKKEEKIETKNEEKVEVKLPKLKPRIP